MGLRALLINLILTITLPFALRFPLVGLIGYFWITIMAPHQIAYGAYALPWGKYFAVLAFLSWMFSKESKAIPANRIIILFSIFFIWTLITSMTAVFPDQMWEILIRFSKVFLMFFVTIGVLRSRARVHALLWMVVISIGYFSVKGGAFVLVSGGNFNVTGIGAIVGDSNESARAFVYVLPIMFYLFWHTSTRFMRMVLFTAIMLSVLALIGTNSRGGFLAFAACCAMVWLNSKFKLKIVLVSVVLVVAVASVLPQSRIKGWTTRIDSTAQYETDTSAQSRLSFWATAIKIANANPLGYGFGSDMANLQNRKGVLVARAWHSAYFSVLADHGYFGLFLFVLLALSTLMYSIRIQKRVQGYPELYWIRDLVILLRAGLIGHLVGVTFIAQAYYEPYYITLSLFVVLGVIADNHLKNHSIVAHTTNSLRPFSA